MHGLQCGFCTPGMILRAYRLLQENPNPTEDRNPLRHFRQLLPLHRLPEHRQGHSIRRRQARRRAVPGGRRMNDMTPTSAERAEKLAGHGLQAQARRGHPLRPRQGQLRRRPEVAGHAVRRLHALATCARAHQEDRHQQGQGGAGRACRAHCRRAETAEPALHAHARRRRAGGAGRGEGAVPEPGSRLRRRRRAAMRRRMEPISSRSNTRRCRATSTRSRRWRRTRRCCARTSRTRPMARTARASTTTTSSPGRWATRTRPTRRSPTPT